MHAIDTQFKAERKAMRSHLGSALVTVAVLLAIASTGARIGKLEPREEEQRAIYYLAPPQEQVETASVAPKSPAEVETFSVDLRELRESAELVMEPIDLAFSPDVSSEIFLEFDVQREFQATAPSLDDFEPFVIFDSADVDERPEIRYAKRPELPGSVRGAEVEVIVFYYVNARGRTERQSVLSCTSEDPVYGDSVKEAIKMWRFKPARKEGKPVPCWVQQTIKFNVGGFSPFSI